MFLGYLFQILSPIAIKSQFFLSQRIKFFHDRASALLKPLLELSIELVSSLHYSLMMISVCYLTVIANFILGLLLHQ